MPFTVTQYSLVASFCGFVDFAFYAALLIAILVAVRPKRPDAGGMLVISASIFLVSFVMRWVLSTFMPLLAERSGVGMSSMYMYPAVNVVLGMILNGVGILCLIVGLVKLASPPNDMRPLHLPPGG